MANTKTTTRRALLKAAPALALVGAGTAMAGEGDTPILRLFRQYEAITEAAGVHVCSGTGKDEDEELERLFYQERDRIEDEMMALPCTCAADFAAKVIVDTCKGGLYSNWETGAIWIEARALIGA